MEQMSLFESKWMQDVIDVIDDISASEELPLGSLQLVKNYSRDKKTVSSFSVTVAKPDYPKGVNPNGRTKNILINIKDITKKTDSETIFAVSVPNNAVSMINTRFPNIPLVKKKSDPISRVTIGENNQELKSFFFALIKLVLNNYFSEGGEKFGCCHLYKECSDAKKCLHENILYARSCIYGSNLKAGRVFYGKNRNV